MALIPLKDSISVKGVLTDSTGEKLIDAWGNPTYKEPINYKCRIDENSKLVVNQQGHEVVSNIQILIGGAVAITYDDEITFTSATGQLITKKPVSVGTIKGISSKVLFTEVSL